MQSALDDYKSYFTSGKPFVSSGGICYPSKDYYNVFLADSRGQKGGKSKNVAKKLSLSSTSKRKTKKKKVVKKLTKATTKKKPTTKKKLTTKKKPTTKKTTKKPNKKVANKLNKVTKTTTKKHNKKKTLKKTKKGGSKILGFETHNVGPQRNINNITAHKPRNSMITLPIVPYTFAKYGQESKLASGGFLKNNYGIAFKTTGGASLPMRWFKPNWKNTGFDVPKGRAGSSCMKSAYGQIIGESFPSTNLAPFPNATGMQTGGKKKTKKTSKTSKTKTSKKRSLKKKR